jgi:small conductance mechanosensitive channel
MQAITDLLSDLDTHALVSLGARVLGALLIFLVGRWIAKALNRLLQKALEARGVEAMLTSFLGNILYAVALLSVALIAVGYLGIAVTPLIAILGGAALAVGLALQSSLSNFASGVMLVGYRPFARGHFVEAGGVSGTVMRVGIFNTELTTPDNRHVIVPNSQITTSPITNYSAHDTRRIDLLIGVDYKDDLALARKTISEVLRAHDKILEEPAPVIMVMDLGESSVDLAVRPWVEAADYWTVRGELLESIKTSLEAAGCSIPFPQRDVHLHRADAPDSPT